MPSHGSGCGIKSAVHLLARRTMSLPYQGVAGVDLREADDSQTEMTAEHASQVAMTVMRLFRSLERVEGGLTPQQYRILKLAGAGGERSARLAERLGVGNAPPTAHPQGLVAGRVGPRR